MWAFDAETLRFVAVNDATVIRCGYTREELLAMTVRDMVAGDDAKPPAHRPRRRVRAVRAGHVGTPDEGRCAAVRRSRRVAVLARRAPAWLIVATDVTERLHTEAALRESEERLRNILTHIPCGVFWKDRASIYLGCNDRVARDRGFGVAGEVVGRTDGDMAATPEDADESRERDRQVIQSGEPLFNTRSRGPAPTARRRRCSPTACRCKTRPAK